MDRANLILTGFMGSGKTTVGRLLAERTGRSFVDTDALIEARAGQSIPDIFAEQGEAAFRTWERTVAQELAGQTGLVIATGGGLLVDERSAALLGATGPVFCLTATPETLVNRLQNDDANRPLLAVNDPAARIGALLAARTGAYAKFIPIPTDHRPPEAVAAAILALLGTRPLPVLAAQRLPVRHPQGEYPVYVGSGLLTGLRELLGVDGPLAVVTDTHVGPLYEALIADAHCVVRVPAGERHKTLATVATIYDTLLAAGCDRQTTVVGLGGGVIGDMAGYAAATYLRGVAFVPSPTSLLAMVDASVGGKTGVDLPQGKNLVGAFKQPRAVVADLGTLTTLPPAELSAGLAEVIKHGLLADPDLLTRVEQLPGPDHFDRLDLSDWQALVAAAIRVKRDVVEEDPFEAGRRAVLNLGHTFAHAIERVSGFAVGHGAAVGLGLVAAADLSARLGHANPHLVERVRGWVDGAGLPVVLPAGFPAVNLYAAMGSDKKKTGGRLHFILLRGIGDPFISADVPQTACLESWQAIGAA